MTVDINSGLENLGDEEEEQGLAEVAEDGNDCQRHPAEVTKRVAWKRVKLRSFELPCEFRQVQLSCLGKPKKGTSCDRAAEAWCPDMATGSTARTCGSVRVARPSPRG